MRPAVPMLWRHLACVGSDLGSEGLICLYGPWSFVCGDNTLGTTTFMGGARVRLGHFPHDTTTSRRWRRW
jgi:hypothetical protein